jgi:hypothetical protein
MYPIKRQPRADELAYALAVLCYVRFGTVTGFAIDIKGGAEIFG